MNNGKKTVQRVVRLTKMKISQKMKAEVGCYP